ncbi:hypothetical protein DB88DRAFT_469652 [Papiliotrema laurentii]|uniref:Uncharacterized protein n=1 Tax=Papiliotrema laurentii TaxID=5418 RepID=A0AAD9FVC5_PAPLA|nr:hypothetical protein DB88DRAFT_469652 [Papiliotrema laurentii]
MHAAEERTNKATLLCRSSPVQLPVLTGQDCPTLTLNVLQDDSHLITDLVKAQHSPARLESPVFKMYLNPELSYRDDSKTNEPGVLEQHKWLLAVIIVLSVLLAILASVCVLKRHKEWSRTKAVNGETSNHMSCLWQTPSNRN